MLTIGNVVTSMHFADALRLSLDLLRTGRHARKTAGVRWSNIRIGGSLTNLEEKVVPSRFAKKPPAPTPGNQLRAKWVGHSVDLTIGGSTARLSWDAALSISQWLRVRGKEARNDAGEHAHWLEIAETVN